MDFRLLELDYDKVKHLSFKDKYYVNNYNSLKDYIHYLPELDSFAKAIRETQEQDYNRVLLHEVINEQYQNRSTERKVTNNIDALLDKNTFTVITAHQPTLLTGPLYFVVKILSAIKLTSDLKNKFPEFKFVPMFILGGEDHDFEECNHLNLFNKTVKWNNDKGGAVGRLDLEKINTVFDEISSILGDTSEIQKDLVKIKAIFSKNTLYGDAILELVHELFKNFGLIVLSMDDSRFKKQMIDIFKDDILKNSSFDIINQTQIKLKSLNFKPQAKPREINLFYLSKNNRNRIIKDGDKYKVLNTKYQFTEAELLKELIDFPENFSPNVILRPLLQEKCIPNLAYIGGGGEIAYWLERRSQFEKYRLKMPVLVRRDSFHIIPKRVTKKISKLDLQTEKLFGDLDSLLSQVAKNKSNEQFDIQTYFTKIDSVFKVMTDNVEKNDVSLTSSVNALKAKTIKGIENIESKYNRSQKRKFENELNSVTNIHNQLFPSGKLMERHVNILEVFHLYGNGIIEKLYENCNPLNKKFKILIETSL